MKKTTKLSMTFLALLSTGVLLTACGDKDKKSTDQTTESVTESTDKGEHEEEVGKTKDDKELTNVIYGEITSLKADSFVVMPSKSSVDGVRKDTPIKVTDSTSLNLKEDDSMIEFQVSDKTKLKPVEGGFTIRENDIKVINVIKKEYTNENEEHDDHGVEMGMETISNSDGMLVGKIISSEADMFPIDSELAITYTTDDDMGKRMEQYKEGETFRIALNGDIPVTKSIPPQVSLGNVVITR